MIYDISPAVTPAMRVWPGDSRYVIHWTMRLENGDSVNLSRITLSPHSGAHADSFLHSADDGAGIGEMSLEHYLGPARVLDLIGDGPIDGARLSRVPWQGAPRLLFKTRPDLPADPYKPPFAHFTPEGIEMLAAAGVMLIGLDTPSFDEFHAKALASHHAMVKHGLAGLENLDLSRVPAGDYELIALPLRLDGLDASPVRAILRTLRESEK